MQRSEQLVKRTPLSAGGGNVKRPAGDDCAEAEGRQMASHKVYQTPDARGKRRFPGSGEGATGGLSTSVSIGVISGTGGRATSGTQEVF
ncbi:MAG: hypothetical protein QM775_07375 [Pirellulales bacterium]